MKDKVHGLAKEYLKDIIQVRRYLHANPELSFKEYKTSKYIQQFLTDNGIPFTAGYVETGIVAHIEGKNPSKKVIALRADMDALPIQEENEVEYKSLVPGVMHACGHDVHTAILLGAAEVLHANRNSLPCSVKLIFHLREPFPHRAEKLT